MIKECLANIECKVVDLIEKHNIIVLEAVAAYVDPARKEKRTVHAVGDGTFIVDGRRLDRRKMMASKLPARRRGVCRQKLRLCRRRQTPTPWPVLPKLSLSR